jgi:hypothetical protein
VNINFLVQLFSAFKLKIGWAQQLKFCPETRLYIFLDWQADQIGCFLTNLYFLTKIDESKVELQAIFLKPPCQAENRRASYEQCDQIGQSFVIFGNDYRKLYKFGLNHDVILWVNHSRQKIKIKAQFWVSFAAFGAFSKTVLVTLATKMICFARIVNCNVLFLIWSSDHLLHWQSKWWTQNLSSQTWLQW